jgi:hypothetical protein
VLRLQSSPASAATDGIEQRGLDLDGVKAIDVFAGIDAV